MAPNNFTLNERIFILESYIQTNNIRETQTLFSAEFSQRRFPDRKTIIRLYNKFILTGSVQNLKPVNKRKPVRTEQKIIDIAVAMTVSPGKPLRKLSIQSGVSYGTARMILKHDLNLHPYKVHVTHQLLPIDYQRRIAFCEWFLTQISPDMNELDDMYWTDEGWFTLNGYVNSQNDRWWSSSNPHCFVETQLHPEKIGVWVAISRRRIFVYFFNKTINTKGYLKILENFHDDLPLASIKNTWIQQDNAAPHKSELSIKFLDKISREINPFSYQVA